MIGQLKEDMDIQVLVMQNHIDEYNKVISSYIDQVSVAVGKANKFYDSVAGAQGIIQWIVNNFDGLSLGSELCGKSKPSWCDFSKTSWSIPSPVIPSVVPLHGLPAVAAMQSYLVSTLNSITDAFEVTVSKNREKMNVLNRDLKQKVVGLNLTSTTDFHQPDYQYASSFENETKSQFDSSQHFRDSLSKNLSTIMNSSVKKGSDSISDFSASDTV